MVDRFIFSSFYCPFLARLSLVNNKGRRFGRAKDGEENN